MVQQTLKLSFGSAWAGRLRAGQRPAATSEDSRDLRMGGPPVLGIRAGAARHFLTSQVARSPGLLSRRVTPNEVANSRTSHSPVWGERKRAGPLVSHC